MKPLPASGIGRFFLRTLAWLLPALALWYAAREWMAMPPGWLAGVLMQGFFPYWVTGAELEGAILTLGTALEVSQGGRVGELAPAANVLSYAYGTPLLAALLLAVRTPGLAWKLPVGALLLVPFQAFGVCLNCLMQVAVLAGASTWQQTGFTGWRIDLIAAGYQIGFLLLPTFMPVMVWLLLDRRMIHTVLLEAALGAAERRG